MAALLIVIGYEGAGAEAKPSLVYLGKSGEAARKAMEKSTVPRFEIARNPVMYRKNNPRAVKPKPQPPSAKVPPTGTNKVPDEEDEK